MRGMSLDSQPHPADRTIYAATLKPHRSLGPRGFRAVMIGAGLVSAFCSLPFFVMGAWPVVGFFGLDVLLLYLFFRWSYHTARAREEIALSALELSVRKISPKGDASHYRFNPAWVRLHREEDEEFGLQRLAVKERARLVDIGGFLAPVERAGFAREFAAALNEAKNGPRFD